MEEGKLLKGKSKLEAFLVRLLRTFDLSVARPERRKKKCRTAYCEYGEPVSTFHLLEQWHNIIPCKPRVHI